MCLRFPAVATRGPQTQMLASPYVNLQMCQHAEAGEGLHMWIHFLFMSPVTT